ncbi:hypothetical protein D9M71_735870 [compost metagenome]
MLYQALTVCDTWKYIAIAVAILLKNVPMTVPIMASLTGDKPLRINEPKPKTIPAPNAEPSIDNKII